MELERALFTLVMVEEFLRVGQRAREKLERIIAKGAMQMERGERRNT